MRVLVVLVLAGMTATGCLRLSRPLRELPPGSWTHRLGNARHAAFLDERVPQRVQIEWNSGLGRGLPALPIVHDGLIIAVVSGGGLITASAETGQRFWSRRFDGSIAGQALRSGSTVYFATEHRNGSVYALDLMRGRRLWSRRLGSSATAEPALGDGRVYVTTQRGEVVAVDTARGDIVWRTRTGSAARHAPVLTGDMMLVGTRDTLVALRRTDGAIISRHPIAGAPSAPIALRGDTIVIAMHPGIVAAYTDVGRRELWRHTTASPVLAAPVITDSGVYALTREAELFRIRPSAMERIVSLDGVATESLTITADGALIGTLDGRLVYVRRDGTTVWEERLMGSIRAPAAVHESAVYVSMLNGRMVKLTSG